MTSISITKSTNVNIKWINIQGYHTFAISYNLRTCIDTVFEIISFELCSIVNSLEYTPAICHYSENIFMDFSVTG